MKESRGGQWERDESGVPARASELLLWKCQNCSRNSALKPKIPPSYAPSPWPPASSWSDFINTSAGFEKQWLRVRHTERQAWRGESAAFWISLHDRHRFHAKRFFAKKKSGVRPSCFPLKVSLKNHLLLDCLWCKIRMHEILLNARECNGNKVSSSRDAGPLPDPCPQPHIESLPF